MGKSLNSVIAVDTVSVLVGAGVLVPGAPAGRRMSGARVYSGVVHADGRLKLTLPANCRAMSRDWDLFGQPGWHCGGHVCRAAGEHL